MTPGQKHTIKKNSSYYLTLTGVDWIDVFTQKNTKKCRIDAFKYFFKTRRLAVFIRIKLYKLSWNVRRSLMFATNATHFFMNGAFNAFGGAAVQILRSRIDRYLDGKKVGEAEDALEEIKTGGNYHMLKELVIFFTLSLGLLSCSSSSEDQDKGNNSYELLISNQEEKAEFISHKIELINASSILVSSTYLDTIYFAEETINKFKELLLKMYNYSRTLNNDLIVDIDKEYDIVFDYLNSYNWKSMSPVSFKEILHSVKNNSDPAFKKFVLKGLYNDLLLQKLSIIEFKYDSLLFACHDSIKKYNLNPYSNSFLITETSQEVFTSSP